jgi:hypothetical protein
MDSRLRGNDVFWSFARGSVNTELIFDAGVFPDASGAQKES